MKTKKSLGQNFLRDPKILKKIADFARIEKIDTVVEIGPGEGTLTKLLLDRAEKVIAVEKDEKLAEELEERFKGLKIEKLKIICGDILNLEPKHIFSPQTQKCTDIFLLENSSCLLQSSSQGISEFMDSKYILVGNIPYYITGALFKKFLSATNQPKSITFVVQKEVAERIAAKDGKESILSISVKAYGTPELGGIIKAGSFSPKPKVDSAIISIRNISRDKFQRSEKNISSLSTDIFLLKNSSCSPQSGSQGTLEKFFSEQKFFEILKAGFAHKRKLLIKNLTSMPRLNLDTGKLREIFKKCSIPEKARAEDLKIDDWFCLAGELW